MTYKETVEYLFSKLPMFHRIGAAAYKADLNNTIALMAFLNHPEKKIKSIHIAGTNGKGSCSHTLAAILQCAGYKTGLYTSPHLVDFRERIRINGEMIAEDFVINFVERIKPFIEEVKPSFFEITVGLCFEYFAQQKIDIAVIETGLGGRLDSTNIIQPMLSCITNISLDHTNLLGDTVKKIAFEKAGIIKANTPVVIGEGQIAKNIFTTTALKLNAPIEFADIEWTVDNINHDNNQLSFSLSNQTKQISISNQLTGNYQIKNSKTVLSCCKILNNIGCCISDENIKEGFSNVKTLTGLKGRWDIIQFNPLIVADIAHNEAGIKSVIEQLSFTKYRKLHIVFGMVKDKDIDKVISLLPKNATYYLCQPNLPRALPVKELNEKMNQSNLKTKCFNTVQLALQHAITSANIEDAIVITGSNFVVAEIY